MRINTPVNNVETEVPDGVFIYSRTDVSGIIVDANEAFAEISGFEVEEMVGQNHNMVRHPDMPKEAFEDMWSSLKRNRPWRGFVKNRRKDGGFYWVLATVTAVRENGRVVGYQSVRARATREEVSKVSEAYARIKNGDNSFKIKDGFIVNSVMDTFQKFSPEMQAQTAIWASLVAGISALASHWLGDVGSAWLGGISLVPILMWILVGSPKQRKLLKETSLFMEKVLTSGDLTQRFPITHGGDLSLLSRQIDLFIGSVRATVQGMDDMANTVQSNALSTRKNIEEVTKAANDQAQSTLSTASMTEELSNSIREVSTRAEHTGSLARESDQRAQKISQENAESFKAIEESAASIQNAAAGVKNLEESSRQIGAITARIKGIAEQTNLLALNAAIEAARAGEAGRGFAVVADEVRKLSEGASQSSQEIANLLSGFQREISITEERMGSGVGNVASSVEIVRKSRESMEAITAGMSNTLSNMAEIASAINEQSKAIDMLAKTVSDISVQAETSMNAADNADKSTRVLEASAKRMKNSVRQYNI